ncbi:MAG: right-handed parallel beta-helix repeat-containing protein [Planctomycetales bacterium]|nr:right-handed parallel beta-helix repeat-containing protein [Planctomycetales bacterium]
MNETRTTWRAIRVLLAWTLFPMVTNAATLYVPRDHATVQAAIDASQPSDTIIVAPGTYGERIHLKEGITLRSAGDEQRGELGLQRAEATIIDGAGIEVVGAHQTTALVTMAEGATIDGFTVTGLGKYDEAMWRKHRATHGDEQPHEDIGAPGAAGIGSLGVACTISNNIVHHIGYTGIALQGAKGKTGAAHVVRNVCYRNMGGGVGAMHGSQALIEENVCFENFYAGIGHENASPTVINNTCYQNIRAGIGISEGACPVVRGNKCYQNRRAGIGTRTGAETRPLIEANECYENDMAGIGTDEHAAPLIRANRCYKNKRAGIGSSGGAAPTIVGNECFENGQSGIGQEGEATVVLVGNNCHHNASAGLGFGDCTAGQATVLDNRIVDNATVAVGIHAGWKVTLAGNELVRQHGMPPIVMVFAGAEAKLTDNTIRGAGVAGIRVAGILRAENNRFVGEQLRRVGPPNVAVWALPGADVELIANQFDSWRHALQATEARVRAVNNTVANFHRAAFVIERPVGDRLLVEGNQFPASEIDAVPMLLDGRAPGMP